MTQPILVVGTGRSGTSAVAGILHKLGVHMGDRFVETGAENPYGTFECRKFQQINSHREAGHISPAVWFRELHKPVESTDPEASLAAPTTYVKNR